MIPDAKKLGKEGPDRDCRGLRTQDSRMDSHSAPDCDRRQSLNYLFKQGLLRTDLGVRPGLAGVPSILQDPRTFALQIRPSQFT